MELKVRVLAARGAQDSSKTAEALRIIRQLVESKKYAGGAAGAATLCELIGQFDEAEIYFRRCAAEMKKAEGTLLLAQFLARRGKPAEALDLCDSAWQDASPDDAAAKSIAVLEVCKPSDA